MPVIFSQKLQFTIMIAFTYTLGTSFTELRLFFHKFSNINNTVILTFCETLYADSIKLFAEASEIFTHVVF
jgi:hypothetical protein